MGIVAASWRRLDRIMYQKPLAPAGTRRPAGKSREPDKRKAAAARGTERPGRRRSLPRDRTDGFPRRPQMPSCFRDQQATENTELASLDPPQSPQQSPRGDEPDRKTGDQSDHAVMPAAHLRTDECSCNHEDEGKKTPKSDHVCTSAEFARDSFPRAPMISAVARRSKDVGRERWPSPSRQPSTQRIAHGISVRYTKIPVQNRMAGRRDAARPPGSARPVRVTRDRSSSASSRHRR